MQKLQGSHFYFDVPIYPCGVHVSFGEAKEIILPSIKFCFKEGEYEFVKNSLDESLGRTIFLNGSGNSVLVMREIPQSLFDIGTLSHEIFHLTDFILDYIGTPLGKESSETYAYLYQYLFNKIIQVLAERYNLKIIVDDYSLDFNGDLFNDEIENLEIIRNPPKADPIEMEFDSLGSIINYPPLGIKVENPTKNYSNIS